MLQPVLCWTLLTIWFITQIPFSPPILAPFPCLRISLAAARLFALTPYRTSASTRCTGTGTNIRTSWP
uniref:Putative secreted protein n=1 Tax=Anopheles darlingi TaxID=43151 RepID=A0A2M4DQX1_ANODA